MLLSQTLTPWVNNVHYCRMTNKQTGTVVLALLYTLVLTDFFLELEAGYCKTTFVLLWLQFMDSADCVSIYTSQMCVLVEREIMRVSVMDNQ